VKDALRHPVVWLVAVVIALTLWLVTRSGPTTDPDATRAARMAVDSAELVRLRDSVARVTAALGRQTARTDSALAGWRAARTQPGTIRWRTAAGAVDTVPGDTVRVTVPLESLPPAQVIAYARGLEGAGDRLQLACTALRDTVTTYRTTCERNTAVLTRNRDDWRGRALDAERANRPFTLGVTGGYSVVRADSSWHAGWGATAGLTIRVSLQRLLHLPRWVPF
jgi:hypothetical protein